jgi:hypothetical protein
MYLSISLLKIVMALLLNQKMERNIGVIISILKIKAIDHSTKVPREVAFMTSMISDQRVDKRLE